MTKWIKTKVIKTEDIPTPDGTWLYEIVLPHPLNEWDVFAVWEKERFASMAEHLKKDDVLFDIGTEHGWMTAIIAKYFTPNVVLFEPTGEFWPNIRQTWEHNDLPTPLGCFHGLVGEETRDATYNLMAWPKASHGELIEKLAYRYLHEHPQDPRTTIDDFVAGSGLIPTAVTIDVEGAELLVLRGAENTLRRYKPKLWISIHPDLGKRDYGLKEGQVQSFLEELGYKGEHLATDHEEHWFFQ